jgi:hypothetical protein
MGLEALEDPAQDDGSRAGGSWWNGLRWGVAGSAMRQEEKGGEGGRFERRVDNKACLLTLCSQVA